MRQTPAISARATLAQLFTTLLLFITASTAHALAPSAALEQLMKNSGATPESVDGQFANAGDAKFNRLVAKHLTGKQIMDAAKTALASKMSASQIDEMNAWYGTAIGQKIVKANLGAAEIKKNPAKKVAKLPDVKERRRLATEFNKATNTHDFARSVTKDMMLALLKAEMGSDESDPMYQLMLMKPDALVGPATEGIIKDMDTAVTWGYRNISTPEQEEYLKFLRTPAAKLFNQTLVESMKASFKEGFEKVGKEL